MADLYGAWTVSLPSETYTWKPDDMLLSDWAAVEEEFGGTFDEWVRGIDQRQADACQVLIWFLRRQSGLVIDRAKVDFPIRQLKTVQVTEDPEDEAATGTNGAATSEPSPDGAGDLPILTP